MLLAMLCAFCMQTAFAEPENAAVNLSRAKSAAVAEASSLSIVLAKEADTKLDVAGLARLPVLLYVCESIDAGIFAPTRPVSGKRRKNEDLRPIRRSVLEFFAKKKYFCRLPE